MDFIKRILSIAGMLAVILFFIGVPDFYSAGTLGKMDLWVNPDIGNRSAIFFFSIVPALFLLFFSNSRDFSIAPTFFPLIELKDLLGTAAYISLCVSTAVIQPEGPLACALSLFSNVVIVILALRVVILEGVWRMLIYRNFGEKCIKIIQIVSVALLVAAIALSFILAPLGIWLPSARDLDNVFGTVFGFPLIIVVSFALVVLIFVINQICGLFGSFADFVSGGTRSSAQRRIYTDYETRICTNCVYYSTFIDDRGDCQAYCNLRIKLPEYGCCSNFRKR